MRARIFIAAVAAFAATAVGSAEAAKPQPQAQPLPADQAQALITAPAAVQSGFSTRAVSPQEALAGASAPGAVVTVAPGLSAQQAVGLAPGVSLSTGTSSVVHIGTTAAAVGCSASSFWREWGLWPYQQRITDTTYWCAVYGDHITYMSSSATGSGALCGTGWTNSQLISGGIGYSWFVTRSSAGFSCPTVVPWITVHPSHYIDVSRNSWGSTAEVGNG